MADTLSVISIVAFVLAVAFFIVSMMLWFVWNIPKTIGDFNMRNAKKSIARMRKESEKKYSDKKVFGKGNETIHTGILSTNKVSIDVDGIELDKTEYMDGTNIMQEDIIKARDAIREKVGFKVIDEVVFVHTEEVIT